MNAVLADIGTTDAKTWELKPLAEVAEILDGKRVPVNAKEREKRQGRVPYYGATGQVGWIDDYLFDEELVLLGEDGAPFLEPSKPKAYVIRGKAWVNNHAHVLRANAVPTGWLAHFLNVVRYEGLVTGTTRLKLTQAAMRQIRVPVAPWDAMERTVAELEKQFSRLDEAVANLKRVKANLRHYVAATLRAAFAGELVPREAALARQQGRLFERGSELLARLVATRDGRNSKVPAVPRSSISGPAIEGWAWTTLGECFKVAVGATPSRKEPAYWGGPVPWVSSGEVQFSRIASTDESITESGLANSSTQINPAGSILLGMIGQGRTRGQAAILDIAAANNQNCAAIWVSRTPVPPEFIYYWLMSRYERTRSEGSGNNQQALNKSLVAAIPLPLPPLVEQHRIVAEVDRCLSIVEEVEDTLSACTDRATRLRAATLANAFDRR